MKTGDHFVDEGEDLKVEIERVGHVVEVDAERIRLKGERLHGCELNIMSCLDGQLRLSL